MKNTKKTINDWLRKRVRDLRPITRRQISRFFRPGEGSLTWKKVLKIAVKNLIRGKSRTVVTVGGVAVGVGAIVLLVSFGYGLQQMVTSKIIWPQALRIAEAMSESSNIKIGKEMVKEIGGMKGVEKAAPSVRLAGEVTFAESKIDAVIVGADWDYLGLSNIKMEGGKMSKEAFGKKFLGEVESLDEVIARGSQEGEVAGVRSDEEAGEVEIGSRIGGEERVIFKLRDDAYVPVFSQPKTTAKVVGYVRGSVLERYEGEYYWGGVYQDLGGRGREVSPGGKVMGRWIGARLPIWDKTDGVYVEKTEEDGFVNLTDASVMTKEGLAIEKMLEEGAVLGETDEASGGAEQLTIGKVGKTATETGKLVELLSGSEKKAREEQAAPVLEVKHDGPREVIISSGMARAWNKKTEELVEKEIEIRFLVAGNLMNRVLGRMLSGKVKYKISGVFEDRGKPMIYVPIADIESMGVTNYSSIKVLAKSEEDLGPVRSLIQTIGLATKSVADTLSQINKLFVVVRFLLGAFGAIALVVALFGMFNTMTVSLLERTREIGVMKSLGTTNMDVARIFLSEAGIISLIGGLVGIGAGAGLGQLVNRLLFTQKGTSMFALPIGFAAAVAIVVVAVGLVTGFYPSKRASKISALNALRYE